LGFLRTQKSKETGMDAKKHPSAQYKFGMHRERWLARNAARWGDASESNRGKFVRCAINKLFGFKFTTASTSPNAIA